MKITKKRIKVFITIDHPFLDIVNDCKYIYLNNSVPINNYMVLWIISKADEICNH